MKQTLIKLSFTAIAFFITHNALAKVQINDAFKDYISTGSSGNITFVGANKDKGNHVIAWDKFDVDKRETVEFYNGNYLNLIKDKKSSLIDGTVINNGGGIYFVNPHGITVSKNATISARSLGFSTAKLSDESIQKFRDKKYSSFDTPKLEITKKGMGKVTLLGEISTNNLQVDAGQIIIRDFSNIRELSNGSHVIGTDTGTSTASTIELVSSTNRIDVGGTSSDKQQYNFDFKKHWNLDEENGLISHIDEIAISNVDELNGLHKDDKAWLTNDIELELKNTIAGDAGFSGTLDGAFNSISYTFENANQTNVGLFSKLENATIKNLKIKDSTISVGSIASNNVQNIGGLSGIIKNSNLENIEITNLQISNLDAIKTSVNLGALAGEIVGIDGTTTLKNTIAYFDTTTDKTISENNYITAGSFAGKTLGNINSEGLIISQSAHNKAISDNKANLKVALNVEESDFSGNNDYVVAKDKNGTLSYTHKGFLKPYFLDSSLDVDKVYDGQKVEIKDDFLKGEIDLSDVINIENKDIKNAGSYEVELSSDYGFYFVREDDVNNPNGTIHVNIAKRDLGEIEIGSDKNNYTVGSKPNFSIKNEDSLNFADGESASDLNLTFTVEGNEDFSKSGEFTVKVSANNENYSYTTKEYKIKFNEKHVMPDGDVDPDFGVNPDQEIDPDFSVDPDDNVDVGPIDPDFSVDPEDNNTIDKNKVKKIMKKIGYLRGCRYCDENLASVLNYIAKYTYDVNELDLILDERAKAHNHEQLNNVKF